MKFGTQLATFVGDIQSEPKVGTQIRRWIDSNTLFVDQRYVWRVGITTAEKHSPRRIKKSDKTFSASIGSIGMPITSEMRWSLSGNSISTPLRSSLP